MALSTVFKPKKETRAILRKYPQISASRVGSMRASCRVLPHTAFDKLRACPVLDTGPNGAPCNHQKVRSA